MAIIEYQAAQAKNKESTTVKSTGEEKERDVVDERLFGRRVNLEQLHPEVKDIFEGGSKMLEEMDKYQTEYSLERTTQRNLLVA